MGHSPFQTAAQPIRTIAIVLALLAAMPAVGFGGFTGADLRNDCTAKPEAGSGALTEDHPRIHPAAFCDGYIQGISESQNGMGFCRRTAADRSSSFERDAILGYLSQHPGRLQEPAHVLVLDALRHAFPCLR